MARLPFESVQDFNLGSAEFFRKTAELGGRFAINAAEKVGVVLPEITDPTLVDQAISVATDRFVEIITSDPAARDDLNETDEYTEQAARIAFGFKERTLDARYIDLTAENSKGPLTAKIESIDPLMLVAKPRVPVFTEIVQQVIAKVSAIEGATPAQWSRILYGLDLIIPNEWFSFSNNVGELDNWRVGNGTPSFFRELVGKRQYSTMPKEFIADIITARTLITHAMMQYPSTDTSTEMLVTEQREKISVFVQKQYSAENPAIGRNGLPIQFKQILSGYAHLATLPIYQHHDTMRQALLVDFLSMSQKICKPHIEQYNKNTLVMADTLKDIAVIYFNIIDSLNASREAVEPNSDYAIQLSTISSRGSELVPKTKAVMDLLQMLLSLQKGSYTIIDYAKSKIAGLTAKSWRGLQAEIVKLFREKDPKAHEKSTQLKAIDTEDKKDKKELANKLRDLDTIAKAKRAMIGWVSAFERITGAKTPKEVLETLMRDLALGTVGMPALIDLAKMGLLDDEAILKEAQKISGSPALVAMQALSIETPFQKFLTIININPELFTLGGRSVGLEQVFPMTKDLLALCNDHVHGFNPEIFRSLGEIDGSLLSEDDKAKLKNGFKTYTDKLISTLEKLDTMNAPYEMKMAARFMILTYFSSYPNFWDVEKKLENSELTLDKLLGIDECREAFVFRLLRERLAKRIQDNEWAGIQQYTHARYPDSALAGIMARLPGQYLATIDSFTFKGTLPIATAWLDNQYWKNKAGLALVVAKNAYLKALATVSNGKLETENPQMALIHLLEGLYGNSVLVQRLLSRKGVTARPIDYPTEKVNDRSVYVLSFPFAAIIEWENLGWAISGTSETELQKYVEAITNNAIAYIDTITDTNELNFVEKNAVALEALSLYQRLLEAEKVERNDYLDRLVEQVITLRDQGQGSDTASLQLELNSAEARNQLEKYSSKHISRNAELLTTLDSINESSRAARMLKVIHSREDLEFFQAGHEAEAKKDIYRRSLAFAREVLYMIHTEFSSRQNKTIFSSSLRLIARKHKEVLQKERALSSNNSNTVLRSSVERTKKEPTPQPAQ